MQASCRPPPPLKLHQASGALELALLPLPVARRLAIAYLIALGGYAAELLCTGHPVMAGLVVVLVAATYLAWRYFTPVGSAAPRRLLVTADGTLHIATVGGSLEPAVLAGESLWLGRNVLLKLCSQATTYFLLLGPGNVDAAVLAALHRRLRGAGSATAGDGDGVDSPAVGSQNSVVEQVICGSSLREIATRTFRRVHGPFSWHARLPPGGED